MTPAIIAVKIMSDRLCRGAENSRGSGSASSLRVSGSGAVTVGLSVIGVDLGKLTLLNVGAKWALESLLGLLSPGRASGEAAPLTIGGWKRGDPAPDSSPRPILVRPWYPTMGPSWGNHLCRCLAPVMIRAKGNNMRAATPGVLCG